MEGLQAVRRPLPFWDVIEESLDEAQFLWRRWEDALSTHARDLAGVAFWIEGRLLAAIDGVRAGGDAAIEHLLVPALEGKDVPRATAAAHALAIEGDERSFSALASAFRAAEGPKLDVFRRAVELSPSDSLIARIERAFTEVGPELATVLWQIHAFRRANPGPAIAQAVTSAHPGLRAAALGALRHVTGTLAQGDIQDCVERNLGAPERGVRDAAIQTALIHGVSSGWARCRELAANPTPGSGPILLLVAMLGDARDQARVLAAVGTEGVGREALIAAGFAGTRAAIEVCLQAMTQEPFAKLAAEAFCAITGLDLERERLLARPRPEPDEPVPFESEDLDADLVPKPEDLLPWPDVPAVFRWWAKHSDRFSGDQRYLGGRRVDLAVLQAALERGPMRRRHATALELAVRTGGRYQVETRAFSAEQLRQMRSFDRLGGNAIPRSPLTQYFSQA